MKYIQLYKLLIEGKVEDYLENNKSKFNDPITSNLFHNVYNVMYKEDKIHNKFSNFYIWIIENYIRGNDKFGIDEVFIDEDRLDEFKVGKVIHNLFQYYLKYNINLNNFKSVKELYEYIEDKQRQEHFSIDPSLAIKIYEDTEKIVILPLNREAAIKYGSTSWCISKPDDTSSWNKYLIKDNKLSYFILYKSSKTINIPKIPKDDKGILRNFNITNIQVDLDNKLYITDTGNTVGTGLEDNNTEVVLRFMKLDSWLFKSLADLDKDKFKKLKDNNPELKSKEEIQLQPLYNKWFDACLYNRLEVIKELLKNPRLDVNIKNKYGDTGFIRACLYNRLEVIKELLKDPRLDVNIKNNDGYTGFIWACVNNYLEVVKKLLTDPRVDVNIQNEYGDAGFIKACKYNRLEVVRELLKDSRVDINIQNNIGNTGFILACLYNSLEVVRELLKDGRVDINIKNNDGNTGFIYACKNNSLEVVRELLKDSRVDVNIKDNNGDTGFIFACSNNYLEVVRELLKDGRVDVNIKNNYGNTGYAFGNEEIKRLIKDSGKLNK